MSKQNFAVAQSIFLSTLVTFACLLSHGEVKEPSSGELTLKVDEHQSETAADKEALARIWKARSYLALPSSPENTEKAARLLRSLIVDVIDSKHFFTSMMMLRSMRESILAEYPDVTEEEFDAAYGSVGVALSRHSDDISREEIIFVLIRDARLLSMAAQITLETYYTYQLGAERGYDPQILEYYKSAAEEGIPRAQVFYGTILFRGWGVEQDVELAIHYLESSDMTDGYLLLASEAAKRGSAKFADYYIEKVESDEQAEVYYEAAISAQENQHYELAFKYLLKTVELDPSNKIAKLELGRHYIEGWGTEMDSRRGFLLMQEAAEGAEGRLAAIVHENLGLLYLYGTGVEKSEELARKHLKKAVEAGSEGARDTLNALGDSLK